MTATRVQVEALTGLRGIAAWLVVLYHVRESFAPSLPAAVTAVFTKGYLAVDLFFVLSGFVLWMTWGPRFAVDGLRAAPGFWRKRVARVWPLHAVVLTATVGFALLIAATGRPLPAAYRWDELPLHYMLIQNWGFTPALAWNDPSWSISTELAAYLLFPLIAAPFAFLSRLAAPLRIAICILAAVTLACALDRFFAAHGYVRLGDDIARTGLIRCLIEFTSGIAICIIWQARSDARMAIASGVFAALLAITAMTGVLRETFAVPLAFAALVLLTAVTSPWRRNPLTWKPALFLGEISYSTYLAHFLMWTLFKIALVRDAADVPISLGAVYIAAVLLASSVLYRLIEVPARQWLGGSSTRPLHPVRA